MSQSFSFCVRVSRLGGMISRRFLTDRIILRLEASLLCTESVAVIRVDMRAEHLRSSAGIKDSQMWPI